MTHPTYLAHYKTLLAPGGAFYLKHDSLAFFCWSLEQLVQCGWHVSELTFDLHESTLPSDYKIKTSYETRWLADGASINLLRAEMLQ